MHEFKEMGMCCVDIPGEQRVEIVRGGRVWAQRGRGHIGSSLGPVFAPVMSTISAQTSRDRLPIHYGT